MTSLEIIHLRLAGDPPQALVDVILESIDADHDPATVRIYSHSKINSDLVVHLKREVADEGALPSELGARLASMLRDYGMVEHSVWEELSCAESIPTR